MVVSHGAYNIISWGCHRPIYIYVPDHKSTHKFHIEINLFLVVPLDKLHAYSSPSSIMFIDISSIAADKPQDKHRNMTKFLNSRFEKKCFNEIDFITIYSEALKIGNSWVEGIRIRYTYTYTYTSIYNCSAGWWFTCHLTATLSSPRVNVKCCFEMQ